MNVNTPGAGEIVGAWALHAGDHIAVPDPGHGSFEAVVKTIRDGHELDWESVDHRASGHLSYSPLDLVNRLSANRSVSV